MKLTKETLIFIGIFIFLLLLGPYFYTFNYKLSANSQDWAYFGTYIGGTLGPIGAFLAFWGLIQQNKMYRENAEAEHLRGKLLSLDNEIVFLTIKCCGSKVLSKYATEPIDLSMLLVFYDPLIKDLIQEKVDDDNIVAGKVKLVGPKPEHHNYRILISITSKLILMNHFISMSCLGASNEESHYNNKYKYLLIEMNRKKWIKFTYFGV